MMVLTDEKIVPDDNIRRAKAEDASRIAEIEIFNYRLYFYPIFRNDEYYFDELQVASEAETYRKDKALLEQTYVYDDGAVKGFIRIDGEEVKKLFVEPVLQGNSIGEKLLEFAVSHHNVKYLWALEKNVRAISFYERHEFHVTADRKPEDGTEEYLVRLERWI